jgi:hypothetical protein
MASGFHFGFRNRIFLRSKVTILASKTNLENQISLFMFPSDTVAQLHPQEPGSLFVTFHDSQGYGGGILTRLHTASLNNQLKKYIRRNADGNDYERRGSFSH